MAFGHASLTEWLRYSMGAECAVPLNDFYRFGSLWAGAATGVAPSGLAALGSRLGAVNWADDAGAVGRSVHRRSGCCYCDRKDVKTTGVSASEAGTLVGWAEEYGISAHGAMTHANKAGYWGSRLHIDIAKMHIPVLEEIATMEFVLLTEPRGERYLELLEFIQPKASHVALVQVVTSPAAIARVQHVFDRLAPSLVEVTRVTEWPGTQLGEGYFADRYVYAASEQVFRVLAQEAEGLFDWTNPDLPDDLHILRGDVVILGSISHEDYAWMSLTRDEYEEAPQGIRDNLRPET